MKNFTTCFLILILFSSLTIAQNSYLDWIIHGGSRSNDIARDIYVDNFGFIYFVCEITDTTLFHDTTLVVNFVEIKISSILETKLISKMELRLRGSKSSHQKTITFFIARGKCT